MTILDLQTFESWEFQTFQPRIGVLKVYAQHSKSL